MLDKSRESYENIPNRRAVLNVLLLGYFFVGLLASTLIVVYRFFSHQQYEGVSAEITLIITLFYLALFFFNRAGFVIFSSIIFLITIILPTYYISYRWGLYAPLGYLFYGLSIIVSGALLGVFASVVTLIMHSVYLIFLNIASCRGWINFDISWAHKPPTHTEAIQAIVILSLCVLINWLSNKEIQKAFARAKQSEKDLQKERDSLEITVKKRTAEVYRFADFGKLASGLIHDLITPLNCISLNLASLKEETEHSQNQNISDTEEILKRTIQTTRDIEKFIRSIKLQLQGQQVESNFDLSLEINQVLEVLAPKATEVKVNLLFENKKNIRTYGNPVRFHQLVINLISNAIEAYSEVKRAKNRIVKIDISQYRQQAVFTVEDQATGIPPQQIDHIFDPFYTTKPTDLGMGIGLSICKDIVEKEFGGKISVKSELDKGTIFEIICPLHKKT